MADENKEENKHQTDEAGNVGKKFSNIQFAKVEDEFNVNVEFDGNSELLSLELINQNTKNVFKQDFNKENVDKITVKCPLQPQLVVKMIIDTLTSKELTATNIRIYLLPNIKQATAKYDEVSAVKQVPDAINIPTGFQPKLNDNNNENNQLENCLLFVLHFNAPPYIYCNYCFIIKEKDVSDNDKLGMRLNDLQKENKSLKDTVDTQQQQINQLIQWLQAQKQQSDEVLASMNELTNTVENQKQQIDQLTQSNTALSQQLQRLETKVDDESKLEEIDLNLQNNWVRHCDEHAPAKAFKIGKVVYLKGVIKSGNNGQIATLPDGWRPVNRQIFCQNQASAAMRVDVHANGNIAYHAGYRGSWIPLDGIVFVIR